jgi:hypothetical protein
MNKKFLSDSGTTLTKLIRTPCERISALGADYCVEGATAHALRLEIQ